MKAAQPPPAADVGEPSGSAASRGFGMLAAVLYQPDPVLQARVSDIDAFGAYLSAVRDTCKNFFSEASRPEFVDVVVAVRPGRRSRVWFVAPERAPADPQLSALQRELEALSAPTVVDGPVAFALLATLGGAKRERPNAEGYRPPMPREWAAIASAHPESLIVPDDILEEAWPGPPSR